MRNPIDVLKLLTEKASVKGYTFERLYRNLYNPDFYLLTYKNIAASPGSMTPGDLPAQPGPQDVYRQEKQPGEKAPAGNPLH